MLPPVLSREFRQEMFRTHCDGGTLQNPMISKETLVPLMRVCGFFGTESLLREIVKDSPEELTEAAFLEIMDRPEVHGALSVGDSSALLRTCLKVFTQPSTPDNLTKLELQNLLKYSKDQISSSDFDQFNKLVTYSDEDQKVSVEELSNLLTQPLSSMLK